MLSFVNLNFLNFELRDAHMTWTITEINNSETRVGNLIFLGKPILENIASNLETLLLTWKRANYIGHKIKFPSQQL